jgi:RNA polymerase sigma factor (sigma-70 family)
MSARLLPFRRPQPRGAVAGPSPPPRPAPLTAGGAPRAGAASVTRFRELVAPHIDAAYSLARYLARDGAAAEDIAQEALLKAFRGPAKPWLLAIVRNTFHDWGRRADTRAVTGPAAEAAIERAPDETLESAESALIRQGDVAALRAAIEAIPEPFREALVLRDLEELSYREVAEVTGAPLGTVMSRLARARRMLAERLGVVEPSA